jgi:transposase
MKKKQAFIPYNQHQLNMLPINLDDLIPENHMVRVVDAAIDKMNTKILFDKYEGGGRSAYNPVMMLKVIAYAYADKIYSSRNIAKATRENINFLWLTGNTQLEFTTINRFRAERLDGIIEDIFAELVELLLREQYIKYENYFLDGTKIEANANKYSWIWGKSTKLYKENLKQKVALHLKAIDVINEAENDEYQESDLPETGNGKEINSESIREAAKKIDERLKDKPNDKQLKKAKKAIEKDYLPRMEKYEKQEEILESRKSYSKTDQDATFMRMKEDHMGNGQLKPGYNVQIGTENQFITGFSIHQRPGDTSTLKEHMEKLEKMHKGKLPRNVIADAGYGSEENYEYLLEQDIVPYVKYNTFHKEASKIWREDPTKVQNFGYDEETDTFYCTEGKALDFIQESKRKSDNGHESIIRIYGSKDCSHCPLREKCVSRDSTSGNRKIYVNRRLNELKEIVRDLLLSDIGLEMRSLRPIEVESVFGNIKGNYGVRRFLLRGLPKVSIEWGLYSIGHNMRKMSASLG